jgi:hypothetical protein
MISDRVFGLGWTALGLAIAVESWRMDRLEAQHINPWTVPGLVPGLLGVVLAVFGLILALRRPLAAGSEAPEGKAEEGKAAEPWRVGLALLLTLGFGIGVLGTGVPFWLAAGGFLFLAILLFEWPERRAAGTLAAGAVRAAIIAALASAAITLIFQEVFLVRLP